MPEGMKEFYPKVYKELEERGFKVFKKRELFGSFRKNSPTGKRIRIVPLDAVLLQNRQVIPTEIKAPSELEIKGLPSGNGLKHDYIKVERDRVNKRVRNKEICRDIGKHIIHMAQAEHRTKEFIDKKWGVKDHEFNDCEIKIGYAIPKSEKENAKKALIDKGVIRFAKIEVTHSVTYIYKVS